MFENKSLIFWQLAIWGYESKPACGSRSRWFETTVPGFSEDVVLSCALLKFPTQQWDVQNWPDISMIFVENWDFSCFQASQKTGHWSIGPFHEDGVQVPCRSQRRTWQHRLRGDFSRASVAFRSLKFSGFHVIPVQTNVCQVRWKCLMGQTRLQKASRSQWFSFLLGVLHLFGLSLTVYLEQEGRKTTNKQSVPDNPRKRSGKQAKQEGNKNETNM